MMNPMTPPNPIGMRLPQFGGAPPSAGQFTQPGAGGAPALPAAPMPDPGGARAMLTPPSSAPVRPFSQIGLPSQMNRLQIPAY